MTFDHAQEAFRANRTCATAGAYLRVALDYEADDMIGDDTFFDAVAEVAAWLSNPRRR